MDIMSVWLYILVLGLQFVGGRSSPCLDVFDYEFESGDVNGIITVYPEDDQRPVSVLDVRINMTIAWNVQDEMSKANLEYWLSQRSDSARLKAHAVDIESFSSENLRMYNGGQVIKYRVPLTSLMSPLPKVTAITVNEDIICFGSGEIPGIISKLVAAVSLHHKSVLNTAASGLTSETQEQGMSVAFFSLFTYDKIIPIGVLYWGKDSAKTNELQPSNGDQGQRDLVKPIKRNEEPIKRNEEPITTDECGVVAGGNERVPLINKGKFYERGEIPWLVAIYKIVDYNLQFICGGTLVSHRHVVTAAHCMQRRNGKTSVIDIVVRMGVHRLNAWGDDLTVTRQLLVATIHKEYNPYTIQNDILILTLNKPVQFNAYIRPACLWSGDTELSRVVGATGVVAGWGGVEVGGKQDEPRMVHVPIVSTKDCRASKPQFHKLTYNTTLCAGDRNGAGPCTGDSGGGLYLLEGGKWRLRGVVSVSLETEKACNLNEYVVYTDTAQFLPWIRNVLSEKHYD